MNYITLPPFENGKPLRISVTVTYDTDSFAPPDRVRLKTTCPMDFMLIPLDCKGEPIHLKSVGVYNIGRCAPDKNYAKIDACNTHSNISQEKPMSYEHYSWLDDEELQERLDESLVMLESARQAWGGLEEHRIFDTIIACYSEVDDYQKAKIERLTVALAESQKELAIAKETATQCAANCEADCCTPSSPTVKAADEPDTDDDEPDPFTKFLIRQALGAALRNAMNARDERETASPFGRRAERPTPTTFAELFGLSAR